ncbi:hypothetical protein J6590_067962 [Homalodisca vitripennis]|nr:hypothetical protein J6590_067962 [Homalodisca vitripennis]
MSYRGYGCKIVIALSDEHCHAAHTTHGTKGQTPREIDYSPRAYGTDITVVITLSF